MCKADEDISVDTYRLHGVPRKQIDHRICLQRANEPTKFLLVNISAFQGTPGDLNDCMYVTNIC